MQAFASPAERRAIGQARRRQLHRGELAHWSAKLRRHDALSIFNHSQRGRLPRLMAIKYQRMMASPFGYFRGAVPVMAWDLSQLPNSGILTQICGDAHVRNLGAYASFDGSLLFDINDFDETLHAPFEWDLRRMSVSLVLAGRQASATKSQCALAVETFVARYARAVRAFSNMPVLEAARYQVHRLDRVRPVSDALMKAERSTPMHSLEQLTEPHAGGRRFKEEPPLLERITGSRAQEILASLTPYRESLLPERRHFLDQYRPVDVALKVVGTGSVGTRCYVVYLQGNDAGDPLMLQIKEEPASAWAPYAPAHGATPPHQGQRVAEGQRAMQLQSDPMLGWTHIGSRDFLVRQLNDHKGSIADNALAGEGLVEYADICGELLARGHCRSGDACMLNGYIGGGKKMASSLAEFGALYADQTERDWEQMKRAMGGATRKSAKDVGTVKSSAKKKRAKRRAAGAN